MPFYYIDRECNGHTEQSSGVELADFAAAGAYALSAARLFHDLLPGERRECAFEVRELSGGWRLKLELGLCLDVAEPATSDVDGGCIGDPDG
jgi:hypothetical protein